MPVKKKAVKKARTRREKKTVTFKRSAEKKMPESQKKAAARRIAILSVLDQGNSVSIEHLVKEFDVVQRTIERDLTVLKEAGIPILGPDKGRYSFLAGYTLRKFSLTQEQASLMSFLFEMATDLGQTFENSFKDLFSRVTMKKLDSPFYVKVSAQQLPLPATTEVGFLQAAIIESNRIRMKYINAAQVEKEYYLEPLKLAFYGGFWYLIAIKNGEKQIQKYRVDRIRDVQNLEDDYFSPQLDINKILDESVNIWFDEKRGDRVLIRVAPEVVPYFKSCCFFPLQKTVEECSDGSMVIATFPAHPEEIKHLIMHWIPCLTVLEPAPFKAEIRAMVDGYLKECGSCAIDLPKEFVGSGNTEIIIKYDKDRLIMVSKNTLENIESEPEFKTFIKALVEDSLKNPHKLQDMHKVWDKEWDMLLKGVDAEDE